VSTRERVSVRAASRLYGTWDLISFRRLADGELLGDVLGSEPVGRLSYTPDGRVTALLMRRARPWPADGDFLRADDARRSVCTGKRRTRSGRTMWDELAWRPLAASSGRGETVRRGHPGYQPE
jgi:hypothetical protein